MRLTDYSQIIPMFSKNVIETQLQNSCERHFELFHSILEQMMNCHYKTVSSNTENKSHSLRIA